MGWPGHIKARKVAQPSANEKETSSANEKETYFVANPIVSVLAGERITL